MVDRLVKPEVAMKLVKIFTLLTALLLVTACEVRMAPSDYWSRLFKTETDTKYYKKKAERLVKELSKDVAEYDINRVTVVDLVNDEGKAPILGEYLSDRVIEAITRKKLFRVTQKGDVKDALARLNLQPSDHYARDDLMSLGKALNSQALVTGKLIDLGTNLDVHLTMVDIVTGEVISSASEHLTRTRFAVEMLRHH